ncbi:MAG TPA: hypothetical protein DEQ28_08735 [Clostridiales bacterium]|nr:hypothetical protein [Clostridiales bacterium]
MQLIMPQPGLLQALKTVCRIVSPRGGGPVLAGVLLEASEGTLRLARTDYETWMELSVPAVVSVPGAIVVPAHQFLELLRHVPAGTVSLRARVRKAKARRLARSFSLEGAGWTAVQFHTRTLSLPCCVLCCRGSLAAVVRRGLRLCGPWGAIR